MEKTIRYLILVLFAFVAELIDGGLGMGYGVSLTSFLLSMGFATAIASASVHMSEIFTTLVSGVSHFKFGNFDKKIFKYLVITGVIGGVLGAYFAVKLQEFTFIKPIVSGILLILGVTIIIKFLKKRQGMARYILPRIRRLLPLGFVAAFVDAIGGGGWGPIATPTLIATNSHPKKTIGSVNSAEFFVTLAISITFLLTLKNIDFTVVLPLIIGGVISAPIAAFLTKKLNHRILGVVVGMLIILLSIRTILIALGIGFLF
jgi:hypothetical protein